MYGRVSNPPLPDYLDPEYILTISFRGVGVVSGISRKCQETVRKIGLEINCKFYVSHLNVTFYDYLHLSSASPKNICPKFIPNISITLYLPILSLLLKPS